MNRWASLDKVHASFQQTKQRLQTEKDGLSTLAAIRVRWSTEGLGDQFNVNSESKLLNRSFTCQFLSNAGRLSRLFLAFSGAVIAS